MIIKDVTGEPFKASINNAPPKTVRQRLTTYSVKTDEDMVEVADAMAEGRDIVLQLSGQDCVYIMVREFIPSKIALPDERETVNPQP